MYIIVYYYRQYYNPFCAFKGILKGGAAHFKPARMVWDVVLAQDDRGFCREV